MLYEVITRRAYSNTIDEVTVIRAEFEYSKNIDTAVNDVTNALSKIRAKLPRDISEPQIIKITEATAPVLVVSMSPKERTTLSLEDIRDIASGEIKHKLLKTKGVANVDIFGGYEKEVQIIVDKEKLDAYHLSLGQVIATIQKNDNEYAVGVITSYSIHYTKLYVEKRKSEVANEALPATETVSVPVVHATQGKLRHTEGYLAQIVSDKSIKLSTKLAGYIEKVYIEESQVVKKGDVLVSIDAIEIGSNIDALKATLLVV